MEGYDIVLLGNFYGLDSFNAYFGNVRNPDPTGPVTSKFIVSAAWRSALTNGALIGEVIGKLATRLIQTVTHTKATLGLFFTGICQDRYGFKKTIGGALVR